MSVLAELGQRVAYDTGFQAACQRYAHGSGSSQAIAVAALKVAGAADLYAQPEFAVKLLDAMPGFRGTAQVEAMRAALAKACGE